jgi:hypothetical protein
MKITWNDPEENLATFDDTVMNPAGGAYLQIYHPLDRKSIAGQEYEYSIRMAVSNAKMLDYSGVAAMPLITGGLLDEGGGKRILLSWYTPDKLTRLLAFSTHASNGGPALPISFMNFNDGKFHTYIVKKYSDKQDGRFKIQVLIDGYAQLNPAADYEGFPDAQNNKYGLVLQTTSPAQATIVLEEFAFGPLNGVPAIPDKSALAISATVPPRLLSPKWSSTENENTVGSDFIPVTGNRNYTLSGKFNGKNAAKLIIEQYQMNYTEADPVKTVIPLEPGKQFSQDFYLKYWIDKVKFHLTGANSSDISSLNLNGGGAYVPETRLPVPEKVPALADTAAIIAKQPPHGFQRLAVPGAPKLLLNGESTGLVFHKGPGPIINQTPDKIGFYGMFRKYGFLKHEVPTIPMPTPGIAPFWMGRDQYDFKVVDAVLERMARSVSDGAWVIDLAVDPYVAWGDEHPEDVTKNQFGQPGYGMHHLLGWGEKQAQTRYLPSVFSQKAKEDIAVMLHKLIPYIENGPYGKMVGGYLITGFNDADFGHWGLPGRKELDDYSPAARTAFSKFLQRKYGNDEGRLQKAWGNSQVNFTSALIPSEARRRGVSSQYMPWIDWSTHQDVADYRECYVEATGDLAESACKTVRKIIGPSKTIHTWAGTPMHGWFYSSAGFKRFLQNPSWDVSVSPMDYNIRLPGYPGGCDTVIDSISLHGKLFLTEQDWRSIAAPTQFENMDFANGRMPSAAALRNGVRRESGMMIAHGQGAHFLDHSNGHYALPELMDSVREAAEVFEKAAKVKERPEADVAIFIGEDSSLYLSDTLESQVYWMRLTRRQRPEWDTSGVPYHLYLQDDLTHKDLPNYKVYIFIAPEFIEEKTRRRIEELKRDGKVLVFLHAPGMIGSADPANAIAKITGMQVRLIPEVTTYAANWEKGPNALLENLSGRFGDRPYSFPHAGVPAKGCAFEIIDPSATVLAKFCANNKPAVAYRDFGTWKSVFMAIPCVDAQFMNNLAKLAGAWVAAASHDAVYANQNFLTVHAQSPGKKTLKLRYPSKVSDAITGEVIADNVSEFSVEMTFGQTRIFRTESNLPIRP